MYVTVKFTKVTIPENPDHFGITMRPKSDSFVTGPSGYIVAVGVKFHDVDVRFVSGVNS